VWVRRVGGGGGGGGGRRKKNEYGIGEKSWRISRFQCIQILYNVVSKSLRVRRCSMPHERNLAGHLPTSQPDIPASTSTLQFPGLATEQTSTEDAAHYNNTRLVKSPTEVSRLCHFVFQQTLRVPSLWPYVNTVFTCRLYGYATRHTESLH